jgi:hypothetical protein
MNFRFSWFLVTLFVTPSFTIFAQTRPYAGFVYPAGGQQGTSFAVKAGGQGISPVTGIELTGKGVTARVVENFKRIGPQEITLLKDQLKELKEGTKVPDAVTATLIERVEKRIEEYCNRPASMALADLAFLEISIAADATPGRREIRLVTPTGISNPLAFHVGQLPESTRKPMLTAPFQVLGKEELSLRKRPEEEIERPIKLPSTVNGQIASGEVNRYRFQARKGQRIVISALARDLIPFIADAVPGWFQPVLALYDANGREIAYEDDFRFKPDPVILFEVPADGEYVAEISDAIHRGREDFIYRMTVGELPYLTGVFPLGGTAGATQSVKIEGWNLEGAEILYPAAGCSPGLHAVSVKKGGKFSNPLPYALDSLPELLEVEPNDPTSPPQKVTLPVIVNGHIGKPNDWDVFTFEGKAKQSVAIAVSARRLDSPLDSVIKIAAPDGTLLALNDDYEDLAAGANTHHADSYALLTLPQDGPYKVHLGDTLRSGGSEYGYRLLLTGAQPDFELRVSPSSTTILGKPNTLLTVHVARHDGYSGPIAISLQNPPPGVIFSPVTIAPGKTSVRITLKCEPAAVGKSVDLEFIGTATIGGHPVHRTAVPSEDRMQAFLWRHLVPTANLRVLVPDLTKTEAVLRPLPPPDPTTLAATKAAAPKFTESQIVGRMKQIDQLFQENLLTDNFAAKRIAECTLTPETN